MNNVIAIRLSYSLSDDSEHVRDFTSVSEAREAVTSDMRDWVVFEVVQPGKYATCGRVLASCEPPDYCDHGVHMDKPCGKCAIEGCSDYVNETPWGESGSAF